MTLYILSQLIGSTLALDYMRAGKSSPPCNTLVAHTPTQNTLPLSAPRLLSSISCLLDFWLEHQLPKQIYTSVITVRPLRPTDHLPGHNNRSCWRHWHSRVRRHQQRALFRDQRRPSHRPLEEGWMARLLLLDVAFFARRPQVYFLTRRNPRCSFRYHFGALHWHERTQITSA